MDGVGEALEKKTHMREVTNGARTIEPLAGGKDRATQRIDHSLVQIVVECAEEESQQCDSLGRPPPPGQRESFVLTGAAAAEAAAVEGDEKRKVPSVVVGDPDRSSLNEDLEKGGVINDALVGSDVDREQPLCCICHVNTATSAVIQLGCGCPVDSGGAHRICAETKFRYTGSWKCEICGEIARNILPEEILPEEITVNSQEENRVNIPWKCLLLKVFLTSFLVWTAVAFWILTCIYATSIWQFIAALCLAVAVILSVFVVGLPLFHRRLRFRASRRKIHDQQFMISN